MILGKVIKEYTGGNPSGTGSFNKLYTHTHAYGKPHKHITTTYTQNLRQKGVPLFQAQLSDASTLSV